MHLSIREIFGAFVVMFAIIDITGSTPIILDLKEKGNKIEPAKVAIGSFIFFIAFLLAGQGMLQLFGVDIASFAIAGALVILVISLEMIFGVEIFKYNDSPEGSPTIVPLIFPLIAGAGALTTMLSLRAEYSVENIIIALILNLIIVYIVLKKIDLLEKILGKSTIYVLRKLFGIIILAMSVKLFVANIIKLLH